MGEHGEIDFTSIIDDNYDSAACQNVCKLIEASIRYCTWHGFQTVDEAENTAEGIRKLIFETENQSKHDGERNARQFWSVIGAMLDKIPPSHIGRDILFGVIFRLDWDIKNDEAWFADCWRDALIALEYKPSSWKLNSESPPPEWSNFIDFLVRLVEFSPETEMDSIIPILADCLEAELPLGVPNALGTIVACKYLKENSSLILEASLKNEYRYREKTQYPPPCGLYAGFPGFNLERWGFWNRRLDDLRGEVFEDTLWYTEKTLDSMDGAGSALLPSPSGR
ncbi:hypothetical protein B0T10DRAFT_72910 [Thelonectria olida]|uniref:Uncharacterized protein n=1 Tax=Thelonectria olida TaxID=1576542 RepID=A0A9P8W2M1_9HYPO|nr:hypothetical protein B0T10DRAFT_72910 [Thelonectria olida]